MEKKQVTELQLPSRDGTQLAAWHFQSKLPPKALVVQWHGNAENMTSHYMFLGWITDEGYDLLTFDYRGYGSSAGRANVDGVYQDALAMIEHAERIAAEKKLPLVFVGQSLGGSLMLRALQEIHPTSLKLIVVEAAFYSYQEIAREKLASFWLTWPLQWLAYPLTTDRYKPGGEGLKKLPSGVPVVLIYSEDDPIIPIHHGEKIFSDLREPKQFWSYPDRGHVAGLFVEDGRLRKKLLQEMKSALVQ